MLSWAATRQSFYRLLSPAWPASFSTWDCCATFMQSNLEAKTGLFHKIQEGVDNLFPGYFALVMATGIVSLAAHFLDMDVVARPLFWLNHGLFVVLVVLTLLRIARVPRRVLTDLTDHQTGPTF